MTDRGRPNDKSGSQAEGRRSGPIPVPTSDPPRATETRARRYGDDGPPPVPSSDEMLHTVLRLNRQVSVEMHDEDIVHAYVDALKILFPDRLLAVRLVAPDSGRLSLAYATGRLLEDRRGLLQVSREALRQYGLGPQGLIDQGVRVLDEHEAVFADTEHGFDVPMVDGHRLVGVLAVEYPKGITPHPEDRAMIGQIALQLTAALRNARLLRESVYLRDYLTKLLDHANAPIVVIGRHREIRVVNQAFVAMLGTTREEVLGGDFVQLLPESERNRLLPVFVNALRGRPTVNVELNMPRRGGGVARLVANMASILSAEGEVEGVIAIGRDLTEVRELEEQVIQAEKLATLGQLAAGVVHELNNPLTSISVYADYLLKQYDGRGIEAGDVEKLRRIVQSAERILRFTRDLVTYARPSTEEPRFLSIHDELDQAVVFCEHVIDESGARVEKCYSSGLPQVYGVKGQLHQVFINLITNACHAMPEGAGHLMIETEEMDDDHLCIRMKDNGSGVPLEDLERIFEPFFSTKGEGRGTGLGLSIVRNIVRQHGGDITVESTVGDGTSFSIVLPFQAGSLRSTT